MWWYELHSPHLINVATVPCESRNTEQWNTTVGYYQRKLHQMYHIELHRNGPVDYKIWDVMQQCVYETKICDMTLLDANLAWLWTDYYQRCDRPVARQSEITCAFWWWALWTHTVKLLFICILWFIRTFYETVNVIWCIWQLFHS